MDILADFLNKNLKVTNMLTLGILALDVGLYV